MISCSRATRVGNSLAKTGSGVTLRSISMWRWVVLLCECVRGLHGIPLLLHRQTPGQRRIPLSRLKGEVLPSSNFSCPPMLTFPTPSPKGIPIRLGRCPSHLGLTGKEMGTSGEKDRIHGGKKTRVVRNRRRVTFLEHWCRV